MCFQERRRGLAALCCLLALLFKPYALLASRLSPGSESPIVLQENILFVIVYPFPQQT